MSILLTGAAGFIGTNLARWLNRQGVDDLVLVDHVGESDKWRNLLGVRCAEYVPRGDLFERLASGRPTEVTAILHMGACSRTTERDFDYLHEHNTRYTLRLFDVAQELGVPLVYASSAATYGDGSSGFRDDHELVPDLVPLNRYGLSKHLVDQSLVRRSGTTAPWYGLKLFNVYGPREFHKGPMASMVLQVAEQLLRDGRVRLFKSTEPGLEHGEQRRDFVFVGDVCRVVGALLAELPPSGIYNVGTGQARTFNELVALVAAELGVEPEVEYVDMPTSLRGKYQNVTRARTDKLRAALPQIEPTPLEEGVAEYVRSLRELGWCDE